MKHNWFNIKDLSLSLLVISFVLWLKTKRISSLINFWFCPKIKKWDKQVCYLKSFVRVTLKQQWTTITCLMITKPTWVTWFNLVASSSSQMNHPCGYVTSFLEALPVAENSLNQFMTSWVNIISYGNEFYVAAFERLMRVMEAYYHLWYEKEGADVWLIYV